MAAARKTSGPIQAIALAALALAGLALFLAAPARARIPVESFKFETTDPGGALAQQSGGHPEQVVTKFTFAKDSEELPLESPRNIVVDLPVGAIGSPSATPLCTEPQLQESKCERETQVGVIALLVPAAFPGGPPLQFPIYNMQAPPGVLAEFGFNALGVTVHLIANIRSEPDYGVTITTLNLPQSLPYTELTTTFWGVPAAASHDQWRAGKNENGEECLALFGPTPDPAVPGEFNKCPSHPEKVLAFLTNPSACSPTSIAFGSVNSWSDPAYSETSGGNFNGAGEPIGITGCGNVEFAPTLEARPTTNVSDSPSGLDVKLHVPQNLAPEGVASAQLQAATLTLPPGMTVNAASAAGLAGCSPAQVGLLTPVGEQNARFDAKSVSCPDAAKLGTVQIVTPVLTKPLVGDVYLATQGENPSASLLGLYIVVEDPTTGVIIKLAGEPRPDPQSGRLTVRFPQNPQLPFEDLQVNMFSGSRAALKTPLSCGDFASGSELVPWTAPEGKTQSPGDSFAIVSAPGGGACPKSDAQAPNSPGFLAGSEDPAAGGYSPFALRVSRADGTQPIKAIDATLPKGLLGRLAGIPYCGDAALAAAAGRSGKAEQVTSSCGAASQVGTVQVGAGAGSTPLYVGGKVYLAGPYAGAPLSLAIITPAVAGPFDLGDVVVRTALRLDPETAQIHAVSDEIPTILQGIPLDLRSIALTIDRPRFVLNPTNCERTAIAAGALSVFGQTAPLNAPFQVGGCAALGFKPTLALRLEGGTKRGRYPALTATLRARPHDANIGRAVVTLPQSEFLAQNHIRTICTRVQFAADSCPAASVYGRARATTPLLDKALSGPVYLRASSNKLPDLVADLNGQIEVALVGRIDSVRGGIRTTFQSVPDAPVTKFVLKMRGGSKGLLQNSRDICRADAAAAVQLDGQNGKIADLSPRLGVRCGRKGHGRHGGKHRHRA